MSIKRLSWAFVRFTGKDGGPCYIDLYQVAAVTPAKMPDELAALGARVVLQSGLALFTKESAETVFEEVHRATSTTEPPTQSNKIGGGMAPMTDNREMLDIPAELTGQLQARNNGLPDA